VAKILAKVFGGHGRFDGAELDNVAGPADGAPKIGSAEVRQREVRSSTVPFVHAHLAAAIGRREVDGWR
jgi:hypothetical protein